MTRVAGALKDPIGNTIVIPQNTHGEVPMEIANHDPGLTLLMKLLSVNSAYLKDTYEPGSSFHQLYKLATEHGKDIEIRSNPGPMNN